MYSEKFEKSTMHAYVLYMEYKLFRNLGPSLQVWCIILSIALDQTVTLLKDHGRLPSFWDCDHIWSIRNGGKDHPMNLSIVPSCVNRSCGAIWCSGKATYLGTFACEAASARLPNWGWECGKRSWKNFFPAQPFF